MLSTTHYLEKIRTQQGRLILTHLSEDSVRDLANVNPVSLALLANRYAYLPNVASLRIFDGNEQPLVVAGPHKTQTNEILKENVRLNDKVIGRIELSLIETTQNEALSYNWWAIFLAFFVHFVLWSLYVLVLRPYDPQTIKSQDNATQNEDILNLKQSLQQKEQLLTEALQEYEQEHQAKQQLVSVFALNIRFFDPKELLRNVSPTLSEHYFETCQVLLDRSIELCCEHFNLDENLVTIEQRFSETGVKITIQHEQTTALDCLFLINCVSSLLFDTLYETYRQHKRFALPTCSAIANQMPALESDAMETTERLLNHAQARQSLVYLDSELLRHIAKHYQLTSLANPHNLLMRQSFMITGMDIEIANIASEFRSEILQYRT